MIDTLNNIKSVHFIGIGGIGVSAIARMFLLQGKKVTGSDGFESEVTDALKKMGAKIYLGHKAENISKGIDLVIFTIAITKDNPEFLMAKELGIKVLSYPESLSLISGEKYTVAISGTHGKTTTTAMIGKMMIDAKLDPTVIVGSFMKINVQGRTLDKTNFVGGQSNYLVVEACEYRRSFLNINPKIVVITNIDDDHLDYYKDLNDIESAFREFAQKLPKNGFVVCNLKDVNVKRALEGLSLNIFDYSTTKVDGLELKVPGRHNIENAKAALAVAEIVGIKREVAIKSLNDYSGTWRRFEYLGKTKSGNMVFDDYGHHPTEIEATLSGSRSVFKKEKFVVVFQPHLYSRTKLLLNKFADAFKEAEKVLIAPIYAAREPFDPSISSVVLAESINKKGAKAQAFKDFDEIKKELEKIDGDSIIITMGAGDVYKIAEGIVENKN